MNSQSNILIWIKTILAIVLVEITTDNIHRTGKGGIKKNLFVERI